MSPDARNKQNDRTALFFAAEMGDLAMVDLLLQHGADVAARDKLHGERPIGAASRNGHVEVVRLLLTRDTTDGAERVAWNGLFQRNVAVLDAALATGRVSAEAQSFLLDEADRSDAKEVADRLRLAGAVPPKPIVLEESILSRYAGSYRSQGKPVPLAVSLRKGGLQVSRGDGSVELAPLDPTFFVPESHRFPTLRFVVKEGVAVAVTVSDGDDWTSYERVTR